MYIKCILTVGCVSSCEGVEKRVTFGRWSDGRWLFEEKFVDLAVIEAFAEDGWWMERWSVRGGNASSWSLIVG